MNIIIMNITLFLNMSSFYFMAESNIMEITDDGNKQQIYCIVKRVLDGSINAQSNNIE